MNASCRMTLRELLKIEEHDGNHWIPFEHFVDNLTETLDKDPDICTTKAKLKYNVKRVFDSYKGTGRNVRCTIDGRELVPVFYVLKYIFRQSDKYPICNDLCREIERFLSSSIASESNEDTIYDLYRQIAQTSIFGSNVQSNIRQCIDSFQCDIPTLYTIHRAHFTDVQWWKICMFEIQFGNSCGNREYGDLQCQTKARWEVLKSLEKFESYSHIIDQTSRECIQRRNGRENIAETNPRVKIADRYLKDQAEMSLVMEVEAVEDTKDTVNTDAILPLHDSGVTSVMNEIKAEAQDYPDELIFNHMELETTLYAAGRTSGMDVLNAAVSTNDNISAETIRVGTHTGEKNVEDTKDTVRTDSTLHDSGVTTDAQYYSDELNFNHMEHETTLDAAGRTSGMDVVDAAVSTNDKLSEETIGIGTHKSEKSRAFSIYPGTFIQNSNLYKHIKTHTANKPYTDERPYKCHKCSATFIKGNDLNKHIKTHIDEKPYKCPECTATFARSSYITAHMRTHTGEKPYKCPHCPAAFSQSTNISKHIRTHTGEKPYKCPNCPVTFSDKSGLNKHIMTHTGEKPYKCLECPAEFVQRYLLKAHIRTHTGENPYKCTKCPETFARKGSRSVHFRTHTGERPRKCPVCPAAFAHSSNLCTHVRTHTDKKPYKCPECAAAFSDKSLLNKHIRTSHTHIRNA